MRHYYKLILLMCIVCTVQQISYAQKTNYQINAYFNFSSFSEETVTTDSSAQKTTIWERSATGFGLITPAFIITKNRVRHEIELSNFGINRNKDIQSATIFGEESYPFRGTRYWDINVGIRYEFAFNLLDAESSSGLFLGTSIQPYLDYVRTLPVTSASFPIRNRQLGTRLHLIPRYTYNIGEKWLVDVNFPIEIIDAFQVRQYVDNPTLTEAQKVNGSAQTNFFDNIFRFRIGIGLKL